MSLNKHLPASKVDTKDHYGVVIIGAGLSGLAAAIQVKRKLGFEDVMVYERSNEIGGTWNYNRYPGAACDIPITFYSYSFAPSATFETQWAGQSEIMNYLHGVQRDFKVNNIAFQSLVSDARYSRETGLWSYNVEDLVTGKKSTKTCNVLITAVGALSIPNDPAFDPKKFKGDVFHSARWNHDVDITGKKVVIVGNGCSAAQIVPEIVDKVGHLTQIARSRQSVIRRPFIPEGKLWNLFLKYIPGLLFIQRCLIFFVSEGMFNISDIKKGERYRSRTVRDTKKYIQEVAPKKYWEALMPDFDVAAKRRVFDSGYYQALNAKNLTLLSDDALDTVKEDRVITKNGVEVEADVIVLCTGFKVQDYMFPLKIYNGEGVSLLDRLQKTNVKTFRGTCISEFPNFFWIMGANTATGHSSVIFTSECQINMTIKLIKPIIEAIQKKETTTGHSSAPAPSVEVTKEAEQQYYDDMRAQMKKKVWEKGGGVSWYVDSKTGLCTTLYPWSQIHYWWNSFWPKESNFKRIGSA